MKASCSSRALDPNDLVEQQLLDVARRRPHHLQTGTIHDNLLEDADQSTWNVISASFSPMPVGGHRAAARRGLEISVQPSTCVPARPATIASISARAPMAARF